MSPFRNNNRCAMNRLDVIIRQYNDEEEDEHENMQVISQVPRSNANDKSVSADEPDELKYGLTQQIVMYDTLATRERNIILKPTNLPLFYYPEIVIKQNGILNRFVQYKKASFLMF